MKQEALVRAEQVITRQMKVAQEIEALWARPPLRPRLFYGS